MSVWESDNGGTVAGKKCSQLIKFSGYVSFYVRANHVPASYSVFFGKGKAYYAVRTLNRAGVAKIAHSVVPHTSGNTSEQLVKYLNHNLHLYHTHFCVQPTNADNEISSDELASVHP